MKCPDSGQIERSVASDPDSRDNEPLRRHLEECETCRAKAAEAAADIRLADQLRNAKRLDPAHAGADPPAEFIGGYRIIREIGRGGMAVVYLAEQEQPKRRVALKVIDAGYTSTSVLRRFEYEVQILGRLQHPGIARIYAAGISDTGGRRQPFFAMELVAGAPITEFVERHRLGIEERLNLLTKLCDALQYAHKKGIIHRDIKPANIYVDASLQPKILDFGVARSTDTDVWTTTLHTRAGQLIGTVPYMSPEQAGGAAAELDTRSDVYSVGVVAYELLTSRLPYNAAEASLADAVRIIREEEPVGPGSVNRRLRGDLETILLKALQKHPDRRYQSAAEFGADIARYLRKEPITARRPTILYHIQTRMRKHPALFATTLIVLVAACTVVGASWRQNARLAEERRVRLEAFQNSTRAYQLYEAAADAQRRNERHDAIDLLDRAVAADPDFALAFLQRAQLRLPPRYYLRRPEFAAAVEAAVEDFVRAHLAAGGDPVRDPTSGRILTWRELDERPADRDGFLKGLAGIRRIRAGRYERITGNGDTERVGGPGLPRALLEAGYILLSAGRARDGARYFERAANAGVDDIYARIAQAGFYTVSYRRDEALERLGELSEHPIGRNSEKVWSFLGFVRSRQAVAPGESTNPAGDAREAARAYREAIRINPNDPGYYVNLGVALRDFGGHDEALAAYERAVEIAPDIPTAWANIGVMLVERARYREAIDAYKKAREITPTNPRTHVSLAFLHLELGECEQAAASAKACAALQPGRTSALDLLAHIHQQCHDLNAAVEAARSVTEITPQESTAWERLGELLLEAGRIDEAEAAFNKCVQLSEGECDGRLGLAAAARKTGRFDIAEQWLKRAGATCPGDLDLQIERAEWLLAQQRRQDADAVLRQALELDFAGPDQWLTLGKELVRFDRPDLAIQAHEKGRLSFESDRSNDVEQARLLLLCEDFALRDPARAIEIIEPLAKPMRNFVDTIELYALALLRNARYEQALENIDRALMLRGENPKVLLWKSIAYAESGQPNLAHVAYYKARQLLEADAEEGDDVTEFLREAEFILAAQPQASRTE